LLDWELINFYGSLHPNNLHFDVSLLDLLQGSNAIAVISLFKSGSLIQNIISPAVLLYLLIILAVLYFLQLEIINN
jgi:hypothetical protein